MAASEQRVKFGYVTYSDMLSRIESGAFDSYDVIYCKDRHTQYLVRPDKTALEIRSRIKVYSTASNAVQDLNTSEDTYIGQLISVAEGDTYRGYVVNQDAYGRYVIVPLYEQPNAIDYNALSNPPIINKYGEYSDPIKLSELNDGLYEIKGYYVVPTSSDVKSTVVGIVVLKENDSIKVITSKSVVDYEIDGVEVTSKKYATEEYIASQNYVSMTELESKDYATNVSVDTKIEAAKAAISEELKNYVDELFEQNVQTMINDTLSERTMTSAEVIEVFNKTN